MATTVHEASVIELMDGTKLETRPLKISLLKPFMRAFNGIQDVQNDNEKSMDVLLDCVQIALQQYKPELAEDRKALEDLIDLPTIYKVIEVASGINLTDPTALLTAVQATK
jgi:uncharacterized protein YaaN involved in tellurite resistance